MVGVGAACMCLGPLKVACDDRDEEGESSDVRDEGGGVQVDAGLGVVLREVERYFWWLWVVGCRWGSSASLTP